MSNQADKRGKKVIVIGASMAGLLAARVLADHFEQVVPAKPMVQEPVKPGLLCC